MCHWNFRWELKSNLGPLLERCATEASSKQQVAAFRKFVWLGTLSWNNQADVIPHLLILSHLKHRIKICSFRLLGLPPTDLVCMPPPREIFNSFFLLRRRHHPTSRDYKTSFFMTDRGQAPRNPRSRREEAWLHSLSLRPLECLTGPGAAWNWNCPRTALWGKMNYF